MKVGILLIYRDNRDESGLFSRFIELPTTPEKVLGEYLASRINDIKHSLEEHGIRAACGLEIPGEKLDSHALVHAMDQDEERLYDIINTELGFYYWDIWEKVKNSDRAFINLEKNRLEIPVSIY